MCFGINKEGGGPAFHLIRMIFYDSNASLVEQSIDVYACFYEY